MKAMKVLILVTLMALAVVPLVGAQETGTWRSSFRVVNLSQTNVASVTVTFYKEDGTVYTPSDLGGGLANPFSLNPGGSALVTLGQIPEAQLPSGFRYSVMISADQPVAAIANLIGQVGTAPNIKSFNGSYSGLEDKGQPEAFAPNFNVSYFGWNSHASIQNLTNAAMPVTIRLMDGATEVYSATQSVAAYSSWHISGAGLPGTVPGSMAYALVASSPNGPVAVVDNQTHDASGRTQDYNGFISGSQTFYCPALFYHAYGKEWGSTIIVQNISDVATTVNVTYSDGTTASQPAAAKASVLFRQHSETHTLASFAATITADQDLAIIVNAANNKAQAQTYSCIPAGATTWQAPLLMKDAYKGAAAQGWRTTIQVMNIDTTNATDVTLTYEGGTCTEMKNIPAGQSAQFPQGPSTCIPAEWSGSGSLTSSGGILVVAVVNQTFGPNQTGTKGDWSMSYNPIPGE